eukprot:scaffold2663_cov256-Pinguiococcus_pyrenoidosus.AAC.15
MKTKHPPTLASCLATCRAVLCLYDLSGVRGTSASTSIAVVPFQGSFDLFFSRLMVLSRTLPTACSQERVSTPDKVVLVRTWPAPLVHAEAHARQRRAAKEGRLELSAESLGDVWPGGLERLQHLGPKRLLRHQLDATLQILVHGAAHAAPRHLRPAPDWTDQGLINNAREMHWQEGKKLEQGRHRAAAGLGRRARGRRRRRVDEQHDGMVDAHV